ncbi:conserved hypothetical protein [Ketogulonicigenium vulgare Y25]|nr:conserved hypothetical protein [Ketogulonicigenium vulgare Y25]AOZ54269.1 HTH-type transcriptional regulator prtR [Ketogulonicigenium vulgare]
MKNVRQGKAKTTNVDDAMKIAAAFGVTLEDFYDGNFSGSGRKTAVAGRIGAGAQVELMDDFAKGDGIYHVETPNHLPTHGIVAVEVTGDSMEPFYESGGVVFYSRDTIGVPSEALNKICVAECEEGKVWLKQVKQGNEPHLFHLLSLNMTAEPMFNRRLKWAAPIKHYLQPELVRKSS